MWDVSCWLNDLLLNLSWDAVLRERVRNGGHEDSIRFILLNLFHLSHLQCTVSNIFIRQFVLGQILAHPKLYLANMISVETFDYGARLTMTEI